MDQTITIDGNSYTGGQIEEMFDENNRTPNGDYVITLGDERYFANYRQNLESDGAPICNREDADFISLKPDNQGFHWAFVVGL